MVDLNIQLPESFFQEEERDGYLVSAKTKELWAVELDLLNEFNRVCKKYNLRYILDFGTLLGAIRHKGFIPWDDDLDVSMLREDYDRLMEIGPKEFKHPYFLQNHETDKGFDGGVVKLRRSDTTCLMQHNIDFHAKYNQGVFIDIFVFDNLPDGNEEELTRIHEESNRAFNIYVSLCHLRSLKKYSLFSRDSLKYYYYRLRLGSLKKWYKKWTSIAKSRTDVQSDFVGSMMFFNFHYRPRRWFEEIIEVPFESMKFLAPKNYDDLLSKTYGDYMKPVKGGSEHTMVYFDVDKPYKEVIRNSEFIESKKEF